MKTFFSVVFALFVFFIIMPSACVMLSMNAARNEEDVSPIRVPEANWLHEADLKQIVDSSRNNESRFNRDYGGRFFDATMPFESITAGLTSNWQVRFGDFLNDSAYCFIHDQKWVDRMANWTKGKPIHLQGKIYSTTLGSLQLHNCAFGE